MLPINPIIAGAAADMLVGMALYSDYTFGPLWTKVTGVKASHQKDMQLRLAGQAVASIMVSSAMFIAILTFKKTELSASQEMLTKIYSWFLKDAGSAQTDVMSSFKIAGFLWLGLWVPAMLSATVWQPNINWQKFALKSAFTLVRVLAIAGALAYFG